MTLEKTILNEEEFAKRQEEDARYYKVSRGDEKKVYLVRTVLKNTNS